MKQYDSRQLGTQAIIDHLEYERGVWTGRGLVRFVDQVTPSQVIELPQSDKPPIPGTMLNVRLINQRWVGIGYAKLPNPKGILLDDGQDYINAGEQEFPAFNVVGGLEGGSREKVGSVRMLSTGEIRFYNIKQGVRLTLGGGSGGNEGFRLHTGGGYSFLDRAGNRSDKFTSGSLRARNYSLFVRSLLEYLAGSVRYVIGSFFMKCTSWLLEATTVEIQCTGLTIESDTVSIVAPDIGMEGDVAVTGKLTTSDKITSGGGITAGGFQVPSSGSPQIDGKNIAKQGDSTKPADGHSHDL